VRSPRSSKAIALLVVLLLALVAGCSGPRHHNSPQVQSPSSALAVGQSAGGLTVDGRQRSYRIYRPAGLTGPAPLVIFLHGGFGTGEQAEGSYHWDTAADAHRFVVAYPDGIGRAWNVGGGCCGRPANDNINDVAFITALVASIGREVSVDPQRVYATGISNGGLMAYRLACDTKIFAAIGPDSATQLGACPDPAPLSVIHIHGAADTRIPYQGGQGNGIAHIDGPSVPSVNADWRTIDQCAAPAAVQNGVVTTSAATCPEGRAVELITIAGAGHQWPGSTSSPLLQRLHLISPPSTALDATSVIWQFFVDHPK
jgi:polyhydroxybutyrate depolymerase